MVLAVVLIALVLATVIFHFASPWYLTELASHWSRIDMTINVTFLVTGLGFILVNLFVAYVVIKYRHRQGGKADYEPENRKLEGWLTGVTAVAVAAMLAPGLFVWAEFVNPPEDAMDVEVLSGQWYYMYRFPGEDGVLGRTDVRFMSPENPFGIDPNDPAGQDDILITSQTVHLPVDQPVRMLLRATDVLHNVTVPQFRVKMDMVPGMVTYKWLTPTRLGTFELLCEQYCGLAHFAMRGRVVVEEQADFEQWLAAQPTFAQTMDRPEGNPQAGAAQYAICAACHGRQGEGNQALNSPKLTGIDSDYLRRQMRYYQQGIRGTAPGDVYGAQMAPMARVVTTAQQLEDILAYIETLPDDPAPVTIEGNERRGRALYSTCAACHGERAEGVWSTRAPRLAGVDDWYLVRQLQNYREGRRGAHPEDIYGEQMRLMANVLVDDQAINDVVAYINTLR